MALAGGCRADARTGALHPSQSTPGFTAPAQLRRQRPVGKDAQHRLRVAGDDRGSGTGSGGDLRPARVATARTGAAARRTVAERIGLQREGGGPRPQPLGIRAGPRRRLTGARGSADPSRCRRQVCRQRQRFCRQRWGPRKLARGQLPADCSGRCRQRDERRRICARRADARSRTDSCHSVADCERTRSHGLDGNRIGPGEVEGGFRPRPVRGAGAFEVERGSGARKQSRQGSLFEPRRSEGCLSVPAAEGSRLDPGPAEGSSCGRIRSLEFARKRQGSGQRPRQVAPHGRPRRDVDSPHG